MGQELWQDSFQPSDYQRFGTRLDDCIDGLAQLLARPGFGTQPATVGAELELSLMHPNGRPAGVNLAVLEALQDPHFTSEINRFNIEYNSAPLPLSGRPFTALGGQLRAALDLVRDCAGPQDALPVPVGILPTLTEADLGPSAMTPTARFRALNDILRQHRKRPFQLNINGQDPLYLEEECVTFEGANTSLQIHLKVHPGQFVQLFNAAQMALGPTLAVTGNSPFFLQHRLWEETRIVVFKQCVDDRNPRASRSHVSPRIGIGTGWWHGEVIDALARHLRAHDVLLPICSEEDIAGRLAAGEVPDLAELRTHNGTIWHWNRPVYDPADGGHLRIEFRALPAGPSLPDMLANAALMLGMTLALAEQGPDCAGFPFDKVEFNYYRAAQNGLAANLVWPHPAGHLHSLPVVQLLDDWLPRAEQALVNAGVDAGEARQQFRIIHHRLASGRTGARWQHDFLTRHGTHCSRYDALHAMIQRYQALSMEAVPVHDWPQP